MSETTQTTCIPLDDRKRRPKLWFDDGNIILATSLSIFRVHRGMLSMNSPVFADMLSLPQPEVAENTIEGLPDIPVVELSDDDQDFTHFLRFCYNPRYYQGGTPTTFGMISGLLRMSTKYQNDELRNEVISHLATAYPTTLQRYAEALKPNAQISLFPSFDGQNFAVARLARETEATVLLPAALWRSSCQPRKDILYGTVSRDRKRHQLTPMDQRICLSVKLHFYSLYVGASFGISSDLREKCQMLRGEKGKCTDIALRWMGNHFKAARDTNDMLQRWESCDIWTDRVCKRCKMHTIVEIAEWKDALWNSLPGQFGLPGWEAVSPAKKVRFSVIGD